MNHQEAMRQSRTPSNCTGEITKGTTFDSQDFNWTLGTCRLCGSQMALLGGFSHRFNYLIVESEPRKDYRKGYAGEVPQ